MLFRSPLVMSGQAWGGEGLIGHPAILDLRSGAGHVIAFNFNPLHRDLNRGDQRMLWNAIINWRAILRGALKRQPGGRGSGAPR